MIKSIFFYKMCILMNFVTSIYYLLTAQYTNLPFSIANAFNGIVIINSIKIMNQFTIIKYINLNLIQTLNRLVSFDNFIAVIKMFVLNYIMVSHNKVCVNLSSCIALVLIYCNFAVIILILLFGCVKFFYDLRYSGLEEAQPVHQLNQDQNYNVMPIYTTYSLTNFVSTSRSSIQCAICLDEQEINESWSKLSCEHSYHSKCIGQWLRVNTVCPVCRKSILVSSIV